MLINKNAMIGDKSARARNVRVLRVPDPKARRAGEEGLSDHKAQAIAPRVLAAVTQTEKEMAREVANVANAPSKAVRKEDPLSSNFSLPK